MSKVLEQGILKLNGMDFEVKVLDSKTVFGRIVIQVSPVAGSGEKWINLERLIIPKEG